MQAGTYLITHIWIGTRLHTLLVSQGSIFEKRSFFPVPPPRRLTIIWPDSIRGRHSCGGAHQCMRADVGELILVLPDCSLTKSNYADSVRGFHGVEPDI